MRALTASKLNSRKNNANSFYFISGEYVLYIIRVYKSMYCRCLKRETEKANFIRKSTPMTFYERAK